MDDLIVSLDSRSHLLVIVCEMTMEFFRFTRQALGMHVISAQLRQANSLSIVIVVEIHLADVLTNDD